MSDERTRHLVRAGVGIPEGESDDHVSVHGTGMVRDVFVRGRRAAMIVNGKYVHLPKTILPDWLTKPFRK